MAFEFPEIRTQIAALLQDNRRDFSKEEVDEAMNAALRQLQKDRPLDLSVDIAGDGTQDYVLPATYIKGFSDILSVETPAGETPRIFRDRTDDWYVYEDPTQSAGNRNRLRFNESTPATGEIIRMILKTTHTVTETTSDLDQNAFMAAVYFSLVLLFRGLAARFTQSTDSTIQADSVDFGARAQSYLFLAERYMTSYKAAVNIGRDIKAAQAMAEADIVFAHGEDMLWHPARTR